VTRPNLAGAAPVFAALGDETRLHLVARLCANGPQSIVRLTDGARVSRQAITKHLRALADAGLVRSTRQGRERIWQIRPRRLSEARRYLDQISDQWDRALARLRALVERDET
jgi:DNA-binding transcriptional ArsR family regulator